MGVTMNHIAAVTAPICGAWLWRHTRNYESPFWVGVGIACVSLIATLWLPREFDRSGSLSTTTPETPPQQEAVALPADDAGSD
jgi:hypothetical protein